MSPRLRTFDRIVVLLVGIALVALGLLAVDWRLGLVTSMPDRLDTGSVTDVLTSGWWPWVFAVVSVLLGLVGLRWLVAHVPTPAGTQVQTVNVDHAGATRLDLSAIATASAARFAELAPVVSSGGSYRRVGGHHVVEVRAAVDDRTSSVLLADAVRTVDADLQAAFEEGGAHLRVLLGSPSRLPTALVGGKGDDAAATSTPESRGTRPSPVTGQRVH